MLGSFGCFCVKVEFSLLAMFQGPAARSIQAAFPSSCDTMLEKLVLLPDLARLTRIIRFPFRSLDIKELYQYSGRMSVVLTTSCTLHTALQSLDDKNDDMMKSGILQILRPAYFLGGKIFCSENQEPHKALIVP